MPAPDAASPIENPVQKMSAMYRWTRHIYDVSRRYYFLGRDDLLRAIAARPGGAVLEVGCGTARNLHRLDEWAPQHQLYGLDASLSMLATARETLDRTHRTDRITLGHGLAQALAPQRQLRTETDFDIVFFSYVLSMIPSWPAALRSTFRHLAPDGRVYIVDFWDQADLPDWVASGLQRWLALFDVYPRPRLVHTLQRLGRIDGVSCVVEPVARRYAYRALLAFDGPVPSEALDRLPASPAAPEGQRYGSSDVIAA
jgi:S-adenosylmethionine-diacylgycerolhomoserine-N-methlytransferase